LQNTEHGTRAGVGFIKDLLLASYARNGYIGDIHRSSFMLVVELITYDRKIDARLKNINSTSSNNIILPELLTCPIKDRPPGGYSYGNGTPTFRHHTRQKSFQPIEVFHQYQKWHGLCDINISSNALISNSDERTISFMWNNDNVYSFLNSKSKKLDAVFITHFMYMLV
jgi:hypothetical protein